MTWLYLVECEEHRKLFGGAEASFGAGWRAAIRFLSSSQPSRDALLEAIASAWCVPPNENKVLDADLANTIADQVIGRKWLPQSQPESKPEWISVTDRLPEVEQSVALLNVHRWEACGGDMERNVHDAGYLNDIHGQKFWSIRGERAQSIAAFTHWMPLPGLPATGRRGDV